MGQTILKLSSKTNNGEYRGKDFDWDDVSRDNSIALTTSSLSESDTHSSASGVKTSSSSSRDDCVLETSTDMGNKLKPSRLHSVSIDSQKECSLHSENGGLVSSVRTELMLSRLDMDMINYKKIMNILLVVVTVIICGLVILLVYVFTLLMLTKRDYNSCLKSSMEISY